MLGQRESDVARLMVMFRLTRIEARMVSLLMSREYVTHEQIILVLWGDKERCYSLPYKILKDAREKLPERTIETLRGVGLCIRPDAKARIKGMLAQCEVAR